MVAGLTRENWIFVLGELVRVTKPGGWIELVELTCMAGNAGPNLAKIGNWMIDAMAQQGVNMNIGIDPGLKHLLEESNVVGVEDKIIHVPMYAVGGKIAKLLKGDFRMVTTFIGPMATRAFGVTKEECDETVELAADEIEEYKSYAEFYFAWGQKPETQIDLE